ncbi:class I SAM-dependent methyltransferase [Mycolicibacterium sp. 050158]|uniref:class I SAM-dependent methyltransferase n=1 Tax=Mycolicibacterium sp. 050158 TaxID=3090602 RepID=UPI00299EF058|nr:class I SAM-dependent methyltransferase [Mycolicibacterium sp. 050158]MDX1891756.1 class I SAM-dependent methyltransferase [Mycolicibacterium sp. 050158]
MRTIKGRTLIQQDGPSRTSSEATDALRSDYDNTPYTSNSFSQSAPGRLAAIAHLFGLSAPEVSRARVLELGCAAGGNLIPFAAAHPAARAVGVDLSQVQIDQGRAHVHQLGLDNLELIAADLAQLDLRALGEFDFVIAHGLYSWVPPEVRDALLATIRAVLVPDGIAYVSYNTYPGWKAKETLRDAMLLASGASTTPQEKARDAREMVDFLATAAPTDSVLAAVVSVAREHALGFADSYLLHDELATFNAPCYFYEMVGHAGAHGLSYLGEAHVETMFPANFGPTVADYLDAKCGGVQVLVEQYLDFALNRMFRESLLVHAEAAARIRHQPDRGRFGGVHVAAWVPPAAEPTSIDHARQEYVVSDATLFTNDPGVKAAMDALSARWPWTSSRAELYDAVHTRLVSAGLTPGDRLAEHLDDLVGVLIMQGAASFRLDPIVPEEGDPRLLRLDPAARRMAEITRTPDGTARTFNAWHETHELTPADALLVPLLDGTRDQDALLAALVAGLDDDPAALAAQVDTLPQRLTEMKLIRLP